MGRSCSRRPGRRSSSRDSFAPTSRDRTIRPPSSATRRRSSPSSTSATRSRPMGRSCLSRSTRGARDAPPGAIHRCVTREAARGGRHRPALDLCLDHLDHRAARLRLAAGQGARPHLHGIRGDAPAQGALRGTGRAGIHRPDGGEPRRDREGGARARPVPRHVLQRRWRPRVARAAGAGGGRRADRVSLDSLGQHPDTGAPVAIRIGRFGPYVQIGQGDGALNASVPDETPPADFSLEQAIELVESRARGPASLGEDPISGLPVYRDDRQVRAVRPARRDTGEGKQREAAPGIPRPGRQRVVPDAPAGARAPLTAAAGRASTRRRARRSPRTSAGSGRTSSAGTSSGPWNPTPRSSRSRSMKRSSS